MLNNKYFIFACFVLSVSLPSLSLISCTGNEDSKVRHLQKGVDYLKQENYDKARLEFKNALQIDPTYAQAFSYLGKIEEHRNEWGEAFAYYSKAVSLNPELLDTQLRIGQFYLLQATQQQGDARSSTLEKLKQKIELILARQPDNHEALSLKASYLAQTNETDQARKLLTRIIEQSPQTVSAILLLSKLYEKDKKYTQSQDTLIRGIKGQPDSIELRLLLSRSYARSNQPEKSIHLLNDVIKREPDSLEHRVTLAKYYTQLERFDDAESVLQDAVRNNGQDPRRHLLLAEFQSIHGSTERAVNTLQQAIEQYPDHPVLSTGLAALYVKSGQTDRAITTLKQLIRQWQVEKPGITARKDLAKIYLESGDTEKAKTLIEEILHEHRKDFEALVLRGKIAILDKQYDSAALSLQSALKTQPDSLEILHLLTEMYLRSDQLLLAEDTLKHTIDLHPRNTQARLTLTRLYMTDGKVDEATSVNQKTLESHPDNIQAIALQSEISAAKGDITGTIAALNRIKQLAPDSADGWFRMGRIYKGEDQLKLARNEFEIAWQKRPDSINLLAELTDLEITLGYYNAASNRLQSILSNNPQHPAASKFMGMVLLAQENYHDAKRYFTQHLKSHPDDATTLLKLASLEVRDNNRAQAIRLLRHGLTLYPDNQQLMTALQNTRHR